MFRRRGRVHWVSSRLLTLEQQPKKNILLIPLPHLKALISQILMHIPLGSAERPILGLCSRWHKETNGALRDRYY